MYHEIKFPKKVNAVHLTNDGFKNLKLLLTFISSYDKTMERTAKTAEGEYWNQFYTGVKFESYDEYHTFIIECILNDM